MVSETSGILQQGWGSTDQKVMEYWSVEAYEIPNSKHQISGFQVSGVRCQGIKAKALNTEH
jgi:hypothetical protein